VAHSVFGDLHALELQSLVLVEHKGLETILIEGDIVEGHQPEGHSTLIYEEPRQQLEGSNQDWNQDHSQFLFSE
jgi:hypothetical protein